MLLAALHHRIVAGKDRKHRPSGDDDVLAFSKIVEDSDRCADSEQRYCAEITGDAVARAGAIERIAADVVVEYDSETLAVRKHEIAWFQYQHAGMRVPPRRRGDRHDAFSHR